MLSRAQDLRAKQLVFGYTRSRLANHKDAPKVIFDLCKRFFDDRSMLFIMTRAQVHALHALTITNADTRHVGQRFAKQGVEFQCGVQLLGMAHQSCQAQLELCVTLPRNVRILRYIFHSHSKHWAFHSHVSKTMRQNTVDDEKQRLACDYGIDYNLHTGQDIDIEFYVEVLNVEYNDGTASFNSAPAMRMNHTTRYRWTIDGEQLEDCRLALAGTRNVPCQFPIRSDAFGDKENWCLMLSPAITHCYGHLDASHIWPSGCVHCVGTPPTCMSLWLCLIRPSVPQVTDRWRRKHTVTTSVRYSCWNGTIRKENEIDAYGESLDAWGRSVSVMLPIGHPSPPLVISVTDPRMLSGMVLAEIDTLHIDVEIELQSESRGLAESLDNLFGWRRKMSWWKWNIRWWMRLSTVNAVAFAGITTYSSAGIMSRVIAAASVLMLVCCEFTCTIKLDLKLAVLAPFTSNPLEFLHS